MFRSLADFVLRPILKSVPGWVLADALRTGHAGFVVRDWPHFTETAVMAAAEAMRDGRKILEVE